MFKLQDKSRVNIGKEKIMQEWGSKRKLTQCRFRAQEGMFLHNRVTLAPSVGRGACRCRAGRAHGQDTEAWAGRAGTCGPGLAVLQSLAVGKELLRAGAPSFTCCMRTANEQLLCKGIDPMERLLLEPPWAARLGVLPVLSPARVPCLPLGRFAEGWRRMSPLHRSPGFCGGAVTVGPRCR